VWESRHSDLFQKGDKKAPDFFLPGTKREDLFQLRAGGKSLGGGFHLRPLRRFLPAFKPADADFESEWKGNPDLKLVTFTVDPERDTAEFLKGYAKDYHAVENQWFFLTGPKEPLVPRDWGWIQSHRRGGARGRAGVRLYPQHPPDIGGRPGQDPGMYDGEQDEDMQKLHQDVKFLMGSQQLMKNPKAGFFYKTFKVIPKIPPEF